MFIIVTRKKEKMRDNFGGEKIVAFGMGMNSSSFVFSLYKLEIYFCVTWQKPPKNCCWFMLTFFLLAICQAYREEGRDVHHHAFHPTIEQVICNATKGSWFYKKCSLKLYVDIQTSFTVRVMFPPAAQYVTDGFSCIVYMWLRGTVQCSWSPPFLSFFLGGGGLWLRSVTTSKPFLLHLILQ